MSIRTVSQINRYVAFALKEDKNLRGVLVRGEISNFSAHGAGHYYFTLKDSECSVKAVMWRSGAERLTFTPDSGMRVIVTADVGIYEQNGAFQLYVSDILPEGEGALHIALAQLKQRLALEGLFDEAAKKPLPAYPRKIGIVTAGGGAALEDILKTLASRYPLAEAVVYPCLVQGAGAPESICAALGRADSDGLDVIIAGRGGGSFEDLAAFSDESVARRIYACNTPIISAVGHETDTSISDYAADYRASTPTAAAIRAVPDIKELYAKINMREDGLKRALSLYIADKTALVLAKEKQLAYLLSLKRKVTEEIKKAAEEIKQKDGAYPRVYKNGEAVESVKALKRGDALTIRLADGEIYAVAERITVHEV